MLDIRRDVQCRIRAGISPLRDAVNLPAQHAELMQMPQATSIRTVTYTFTEPEIVAYGRVVDRQRGRPRSMLSTIYVPAVLGAILIAVRAGHDDFGAMLVAGAIAYLGGVLALRHEVLQVYDLRFAAFIRDGLEGPRHVRLGDDALEYSARGISARYDYAAFAGFEVSQGFMLGWLGNDGAVPVPIRAFASAGEADAFADDMRSRIAAARPAETPSSASDSAGRVSEA